MQGKAQRTLFLQQRIRKNIKVMHFKPNVRYVLKDFSERFETGDRTQI